MRRTHESEPHIEEQRLLERWLERGDRAAREELVQRLLPLARRLARRYDGMGDSFATPARSFTSRAPCTRA